MLDMQLHGTGKNIDTEAQIDPTYRALRSSLRPLDYEDVDGLIGGHFSWAGKTGATTVIAAGGAIFTMRWPGGATKKMRLQRLLVDFTITTAFTTAQVVDVDLVRVPGYTVLDTGGTAISLASTCKLSSVMAPSDVTDMRIATTAALTPGTGTSEANAVAIAACGPMNANNAVGAYSGLVTLFDAVAGHEHPMDFAGNEGFRVRLATTMGAVGVGNFGIRVVWSELPPACL